MLPGGEQADWASTPRTALKAVSQSMKVQEASKCRLVCSSFASSMPLSKMRVSLPPPNPQQQEELLQQLSKGSIYHGISHFHATLTLPMEGDLVPLAVALAGLPSLECMSLRSELAPQLAPEASLITPLQPLHRSGTGRGSERKPRSAWRWLSSSSSSAAVPASAGPAAPTASATLYTSTTTASSSSSSSRTYPAGHTAEQALVGSQPWMSLAVSQGLKLRSLDLDLHSWPSPMQFHLLLTRLTGLSSLAVRHAPVNILQALTAAPQLQQLTFIGQLDQAVSKGCLRSGLLPPLPGVTRLVILSLPMGVRQQELEDIQASSSTQLVSSSILRSCPSLVDLRSDLELGPAVAGLTALTTLQGAHPAALPALAAAAAATADPAPATWLPGAVGVEQVAADQLAAGEVPGAVDGQFTMLQSTAVATPAAAGAVAGPPVVGTVAVPARGGLRHLGVGVDTPLDCQALSRLTHLESLMLWPSSERAARAAEYQGALQQQQHAAQLQLEAAAAAAIAAAAAPAVCGVAEDGALSGVKGAAHSILHLVCNAGGDSSSLSSTCTSGVAGGFGTFSSVGSSSMGSSSSMGERGPAPSLESGSPQAGAQYCAGLSSPQHGGTHVDPAANPRRQLQKPSRRLSARLLQQWGRATAAMQRLMSPGPRSAQRSTRALGRGSTPTGPAAACSPPEAISSSLGRLSLAKRSMSLALEVAAGGGTSAVVRVLAPPPDVRLMLGGGLEQRLVRLRLLGGWQLDAAQTAAMRSACPRLRELSCA